MPELAEVEYYRKQWDPGLNQKVSGVTCRENLRIFRGIPPGSLTATLQGARLLSSETHGKQMLFRFDKGCLGVHLGMTGELFAEKADHAPAKHAHLILHQKGRDLVFSDPRLFGRIRLHSGKGDPEWWKDLPPDPRSKDFTLPIVQQALSRRKNTPLKALLLQQEHFPGIGNWMADEILWQSRLHPAQKSGTLTEDESRTLWKTTREVSKQALRVIGKDFSDPPDSWLFSHRWKKGGICPRCGVELERAEIGGRTTCWCAHCQPK